MDSLFVAAIDFGTTYSGWACSFRGDYEKDPTKVSAKTWNSGSHMSLKAPTCLLIKSDGTTLDSFGYDAETKYAELSLDRKHTDWYFFKRFKMMLFTHKTIDRNVMLEDAAGQKRLPAIRVFALAINFLKDDVMKSVGKTLCNGELTEDDIHWVITVPAIWNDAAKQFMREAAQQAGISGKKLTICLEPEAASIYCRHLPVEMSQAREKLSLASFPPGTQYMILDAGGGTVDITVHEILPNGDLREIHKATGGAWGGTKVDEEFEILLGNIFGRGVVAKFKDNYLDDYIEMFRDFEIKKRAISLTEVTQVTMMFPQTFFELVQESSGCAIGDFVQKTIFKDRLKVQGGKLRFKADMIKSCFASSLISILSHVQSLVSESIMHNCSAIVMVGGFSESKLLQENIHDRFGGLKIIIPFDAGLAVLKGAVIFGHNPKTISERVCKYTYGYETAHKTSPSCEHPEGRQEPDKNGVMRCWNIFSIQAKVGQAVKIGEEVAETVCLPMYDSQTAVTWDIYASAEVNPYFVTENGCIKVGTLTVSCPLAHGDVKREFGVRFKFGGTEIEVIVLNKLTGERTIKTVDFLG